MFSTLESYKELNIDGVTVTSRRGFKGNQEHGILEVIEIKGRKEGKLNGKQGSWGRGQLYNTDRYSYDEAMRQWRNEELTKFNEITNESNNESI